MKSLKKKFRSVKKWPYWIFFPLVLLLEFWSLLMRRAVYDPNNILNKILDSKEIFIPVIWHNRLLFFPCCCPKRGRIRTAAVISPSRDGQYVADIMKVFGIKSIRGSSSKKGASVLRKGSDAVKSGFHVCFTPDGPRGPRYSVSPGAVYLASKTGKKILPMIVNANDYWEIKSWDRFQIPKPWSKIRLHVGEPITIPSKLSDDDIKKYRNIVREAMLKITEDKNSEK